MGTQDSGTANHETGVNFINVTRSICNTYILTRAPGISPWKSDSKMGISGTCVKVGQLSPEIGALGSYLKSSSHRAVWSGWSAL